MKNDVTVLIPLYNEEQHIEKTILSVVNQAEFVIISDNGSNDGSYNICKKLKKIYKNIKLFKQTTNLGGIGNLQFLYSQTKTKYTMNIGAHDYIIPNYINTLKQCLDENSDIIMAYAPVINVNDNNKILEELMLDDFSEGFSSNDVLKRIYTAITMEYNYTFLGLFRTNIFLKNADFKKEAGIDHLVIAKCAKDGKFMRCTDTRFYLRIPTREETVEAYMKRLSGKAVEIDMSYTCVNLLNLLKSTDSENNEEKNRIYNIAQLYLQNKYANHFKKYTQFLLEKLSKSSDKYILYGAGTDALKIIPNLKDTIIFIVDQDSNKHGLEMHDIKIYPIEKIYEYPDNQIIISQLGRFDLISTEIINKYNISLSKLISLDHINYELDYE